MLFKHKLDKGNYYQIKLFKIIFSKRMFLNYYIQLRCQFFFQIQFVTFSFSLILINNHNPTKHNYRQ